MKAARVARARVARFAYPRESLEAAALVLGSRAEVLLTASRSGWGVELRAPASGQDVAALLREFLDEALAHARRRESLSRARATASALAARLLQAGFPAVPPDPLEQLEPQVRADRAEDLAALLARARSLP